MADRRTSLNQPLYETLVLRVRQKGKLPINSEEAMAYWVTVLQRLASEFEFGTNSDPIADAPRMMAFKSREGLSEIDLLRDDPANLLDWTWSLIELWEN